MSSWIDPRDAATTTKITDYPSGIALHPNPRALPRRYDSTFLYGSLGLPLHEMGWATIPETRDADNRKPGRVKGAGPTAGTIKYKNVFHMHQQLAPINAVKAWADELGYLNVAGVTGDSFGTCGWFLLDFDILRPELADQIYALADEIFGVSPFIRGRDSVSKRARIYTRPLGALRLPSKNFVLEEMHDGEKQAIEIKDDGGLATLYGFHHKSGERFKYYGSAEPFTAPPSAAPLVDESQLMAFIERLHTEISPIVGFEKLKRKMTAVPVRYADTDVGDTRVPPMPAELAAFSYASEGRKDWLLKRSLPWARWNAGIVAPLDGGRRDVSEEGIAAIANAMVHESEQHLDFSAGKGLTTNTVHRHVADLLRSAAQKIADGVEGYEAIGTRRINELTQVVEHNVGQGVVQLDAEFSWLPKTADRKRIPDDIYARNDPDALAATAVALVHNRIEITQRVSREIRAAIWQFLEDLWEWKTAADSKNKKKTLLPAHLLKAPTGSGKTTTLLTVLGEWKREYPDRTLGPILMLLPSYANIEEIAGRDDLGVWTKETQEAAADIIAKAEGRGVKAMVYRGKIAAGCMMDEKVKLLQSAGINTSGLCKADDIEKEEVDGETRNNKVTKWCTYHPENPDRDDSTPSCNAILQQLGIPLSDLVLAPHAFITTNTPAALKDVTAVIVDERVWDKAIGTKFFSLDTFTTPRDEPAVTKKEKEKGVVAWHRVQSRDELGAVIVAALKDRKDVAAAILAHKDGPTLLEHGRWVTGRLQRVAMDINPSTPLANIIAATSGMRAKNLVEEHQALGIFEDRVQAFKQSDISPTLAPKGETDARVQLVDDGENVRISWRKKLNFDDKPVLWLDASGDQKVLEKIWQRDVTVHEIEAPLFVRCVWAPDGSYAKSRLLPHHGDSFEARLGKAAKQCLLREGLTAISMLHGDGGVVAAAALNVRKDLQQNFHQPANLHFMHFGNIRGLDFAKHHGAAVSIGQLELRPRDLDAIIGALTYDDDVPEKPTDPFGNGRQGLEDDAPKIERRMVDREVPLRDGGKAVVKVFEPEGEWAKIVVEQVREEELSQFLGRLRPVYRSGRAPVWYHFGRVLPRGVVVDEVITLEDLARPFGRSLPIIHELGIGKVIREDRLFNPYFSGLGTAAIEGAFQTLSRNERMSQGFYKIHYTLKNEWDGKILQHTPHFAFVPGYEADPLAIVKAQVSELEDEPRIAFAPRHSTFTLPAPDKIEIELGDDRTSEITALLSGLDMREEYGQVTYDEKRHGILLNGRTQSPHVYVAFEMLSDRVKKMAAEHEVATILDGVPAEAFMLSEMDADQIVTTLEEFDDKTVAVILEHAEVDQDLRHAVTKERAKRPPVELSFGKGQPAPTPANSSESMADAPDNVVRFAALPKFKAFKPSTMPTASK
ncbi:hypothetical protein [Pelagibacterium sediminicola]|uniref:hypothetical protein n=1 Tax=Pelagibacterium sediminicola TaxID=2248761 RepID=UPI0013009C84|nr:hypothetical protein [Pelagibacterium sediminicola]